MQEVQQLIVDAYETARSFGKLYRNKMTTAVLKNRLRPSARDMGVSTYWTPEFESKVIYRRRVTEEAGNTRHTRRSLGP